MTRPSSEHRAAGAGVRRRIGASIVVAGIAAYAALGLTPAEMLPSLDTLASLQRFLGHALTPALHYESGHVPAGAPPLILEALHAGRRTVAFAAAAMSLALIGGSLFGFLGSKAWWPREVASHGGATALLLRTALAVVHTTARALIAWTRSIHELLWAVLLLAAIGLTDVSAVVAIAIPYSGVLGKVFSEMIDEAPRDAADALAAAGASPAQTYLFGLVPRAAADMGAYTLYRFECALRSSAVLGFFGPETLGKFIKQSWNENYYGEVWTYLYTLFVLIALVDWWSGAMRRRFAA
jgi:phosphonate transport system permease protein